MSYFSFVSLLPLFWFPSFLNRNFILKLTRTQWCWYRRVECRLFQTDRYRQHSTHKKKRFSLHWWLRSHFLFFPVTSIMDSPWRSDRYCAVRACDRHVWTLLRSQPALLSGQTSHQFSLHLNIPAYRFTKPKQISKECTVPTRAGNLLTVVRVREDWTSSHLIKSTACNHRYSRRHGPSLNPRDPSYPLTHGDVIAPVGRLTVAWCHPLDANHTPRLCLGDLSRIRDNRRLWWCHPSQLAAVRLWHGTCDRWSDEADGDQVRAAGGRKWI